jgi:hypothetical protein
MGRFQLVRLRRELLRDKQIRPMSDWGQMVAGSNPVSPTSVSPTRVIAAQSTNGACVGCRSDTGRGKYGNPIKTPRPFSDRWRRPFRSGSGECR